MSRQIDRRIAAALAATLLAPPAIAADYSILYPFRGQGDGARPLGLILDDAGNAYGQTQLGGDNCPDSDGVHGCGTVFRISPTGTITVLARFEGPNGANGNTVGLVPGIPPLIPLPAPLILRQNTLYGMTTNGGAADVGVVFSVKTNGTNFTVLHQFNGADGAYPVGALALGKSRNIFGTTAYGGPNYQPGALAGNGVLFEILPDGTFKALHDFTAGADNFEPNGVVVDRSGNVFGTTSGATVALAGTAYEYQPATGSIFTLHNFVGPEFIPQVSGFDSNGNLYGYVCGCTFGASAGYLFEFKDGSAGFEYMNLFDFDTTSTTNGFSPSGLSVDAKGVLTGVTLYGPTSPYPAEPNGKGTIFQYQAGKLTTFYAFNGGSKEGFFPIGAPAVTSSGAIVGETLNNGPHCALRGDQRDGCGVVFDFTQ